MKRLALFSILVTTLGMAACGGGSSGTPPPPTGGFSNASLHGQYAFSMSGIDLNGGYIARTGAFIADGNGFNHNFRTLIVDAHGRLQTVLPAGGDLSDQIVSELLKAAAVTNQTD